MVPLADSEDGRRLIASLNHCGLFAGIRHSGFTLTLFGPVVLPRLVAGRTATFRWYTCVRNPAPAAGDSRPAQPSLEDLGTSPCVSSILVHGDIQLEEAPLLRLHSCCLTGDVFGSLRCDCGAQLERSFELIVESGAGIVVYLASHEGRGIGLWHKALAYYLQERGLDTYAANAALGLPDDVRDYGEAAAALLYLLGDVHQVRLLSNNPRKAAALEEHGIHVREIVPVVSGLTEINAAYLSAKREHGHLLPEIAPRTPAPGHGCPA